MEGKARSIRTGKERRGEGGMVSGSPGGRAWFACAASDIEGNDNIQAVLSGQFWTILRHPDAKGGCLGMDSGVIRA